MGVRMRFLALLLAMAVVICPVRISFATIGPVEVQLSNPNGEMRKARANRENTLSIRFRINVNIKVHDWVKIWFPIDEASCDPKDICDGLPEINGKLEHPRFVPNAKYFEKYPDSEEKKIGKLYEVMDDRKGNTNFETCDGNCCSEGKCRIVADKSGLGSWIMGTVMPALPYDETERYRKLRELSRSDYYGFFNPCDCCSSLPFITNTCKERLFQANSALEIDAWRKGYNPVQITFHKRTGIIYPATPGRYRIVIATAPESTPVESEIFNLPCSKVTEPVASVSTPELNENVSLSLKFATGEGGALDKNISKIYVRFPKEFSFSKIPESARVQSAKLGVETDASFDAIENVLSLVVPFNIDSDQELTVKIDGDQGLMTPSVKSNCQFEVWTDSEPEAVKSKILTIDDVPYVQTVPDFEMTPASYRMIAQAPKDGIKKGEKIVLLFPESAFLPDKIIGKNVLINKTPCTVNPMVMGNRMMIMAPANIAGILKIQIIEAKISNPKKGTHKLEYIHNNTNYPIADFETKESLAFVESVKLTNYSACQDAGFEIVYHPSSSNPVKPEDEIVVEFPNEYLLSPDIKSEMVRINGKNPPYVKINENRIIICSPVFCEFPNSIKIIVSEEAKIKNSPIGDGFTITIGCGGNNLAESEIIPFDPPKIESKLNLIWDSDDKTVEFEGGVWHNTPPILSFDYCNPYQEVIFWFDNKEFALFSYTGAKKMSPGSSRTVIHYYAKMGENKEETKSETLYLDTIPPDMQFDPSPYKNKYTNKIVETLAFRRTWHELLTWGDNEKYSMADGIRVNGKSLCEPEIIFWGDKKQADEVRRLISHNILLAEGENQVTVSAFDQFGQTRDFFLNIIRDTIVPRFTIKNLRNGDFVDVDMFNLEIESEPGIDFYLDNTFISPLSESPSGDKIVYTFEPTIWSGYNSFKVKAVDKAGNFSEQEITFYGGKFHTTELWLGNKKATKDTNEPISFTVAPSSSSPPLPKDFAGTTFVEAVTLARAMGFSTKYDIRQKMLELDKRLPNNEKVNAKLWVGKQRMVINGKEAPIDGNKPLTPVIIGGKFMIPARILATLSKGNIEFRTEDSRIKISWFE